MTVLELLVLASRRQRTAYRSWRRKIAAFDYVWRVAAADLRANMCSKDIKMQHHSAKHILPVISSVGPPPRQHPLAGLVVIGRLKEERDGRDRHLTKSNQDFMARRVRRYWKILQESLEKTEAILPLSPRVLLSLIRST